MTEQEFQSLFAGRVLLLDGATGSNLQKNGMPAGVCPERWMLDHPSALKELQREYAQAGSRIVYAPTFTANRFKLEEYGLGEETGKINAQLVRLTREAVGSDVLVAGDLTMTGRQLSPIGTLDVEELIEVYKEQAEALARAGADLLVVETMMSLQEARAAVIAAKETCSLPVLVTMTFEKDGRTLYGTDAVTAAVVLEGLGADAVGANCSTGPDQMESVIRAMAGAVSIPVIAKPNAGLPLLDEDGNTVYSMDKEEFALHMERLVEAGASIVGGCCGTTPEFIRELAGRLEGVRLPERARPSGYRLSSQRRTLRFGLDSPLLIVGERINPTGKKKLQEQLRNGDLGQVADMAREQEKNGASLLDVNLGMSGIDEKAMMLRAIDEIGQVCDLPLVLDSSHENVLEAALRRYPGRALVNSVSGESGRAESLLPLVKKYGAMFILLPLSDSGLPKNLEERLRIIGRITEQAYAAGLKKEDIVVDGLTATVGAEPEAGLNTLQTIRYCRENGYATICGLSNISFGLPGRGYVNAAFLTMAAGAGLTMAIANPSQKLLTAGALASDLLLHKEEAALRYIQAMSVEEKGEGEGAARKASPVEEEKDGLGLVYKAVLNGDRLHIVEYTAKAVEEEKLEPGEVLNRALMPAINRVGELFEQGKYFLPQLIAGAEAMKASIGYLEPLLRSAGETKKMPVVVIATVKGDIHDIGKNLVALMLKNYGFRVMDLGKDVPRETIVGAAVENHAGIIALSALMTTTMQEMRRVVEYARERKAEAKIIIGGAVITQEYAEEIGADGYSRDAADAVKVCRRLLSMED